VTFICATRLHQHLEGQKNKNYTIKRRTRIQGGRNGGGVGRRKRRTKSEETEVKYLYQ
jgi:hypothetical protein